jgi:membrane-associated protease RseP (regulator of RpoE activity)
LEDNFSWTIPLTKLSGLVLSFLIAFLLTFGITKSTKDVFIKNSDAVYGSKFDSVLKRFGFRDSMRIKSINGEEIDRVSDILKKILFEDGDAEVSVELNGVQQEIILRKSHKLKLLKNPGSNPIVPIMTNGKNEIKVTTVDYGFSDVLNTFGTLWDQAMFLINPEPTVHTGLNGFAVISKINNFREYLMVLSLNLIIIGILNLLPLPGFGIGNFIVSGIETLRKKRYNEKRKRAIGWISILLVIAILGISMI